ncbi:MAG: RNA methyltransferase, TrmA family [uncultured Thermomicrobiales bacterium]|uniref:RNA methyltransferase, TrmA family n=1 Tax=uncultured Thermomicrobiales bacterium TaxID=1645740 RepID=A0A6J4UR53_9BACT|nr:MAG: RNA methyltransferase, TrmA family [uncultured Thermomicrobiales bacterium]
MSAMDRRAGPSFVGETIETTVERLVAGGVGLAHAPGKTLFVAAAAPGDRVRVRIERDQGKVAHARIVDLLEPSSDRIEPPFPGLAASGAAGFAHLRYPAQLAAKQTIVHDALRRIGGIPLEAPPEIVPSPREWGYRIRAEWHYDPVQPALGFLAAGSRRVVDLPDDPLVVPELALAYADIRATMMAGRLGDEALTIQAATAGGDVSLHPDPDGGEPREIVAEVAGERLAFDARCFFQGNGSLLEPLVEEAMRFADVPSAESPALDLFCGVGFFTLPLARRHRRVIGLELDPHSAIFAQRNADEAGLRGVRIAAQSVEDWGKEAFRSYGRPAFLLLDPPRGGLAPSAARGLLKLRPGRVTYVSCDPATLARDLKLLMGDGYVLERLVAFDLFPQTPHVEVVAHLTRTTEEAG